VAGGSPGDDLRSTGSGLEAPVTDPGYGKIVVRRSHGPYRDLLRRYTIEVDGVVRGSVAREGQIEIEVPGGVHEVRATIDWTGSPSVPVQVRPGRTVTLQVEPAGGVFAAFLQVWRRDAYLHLERVTGL
jgi:hypothetical protein